MKAGLGPLSQQRVLLPRPSTFTNHQRPTRLNGGSQITEVDRCSLDPFSWLPLLFLGMKSKDLVHHEQFNLQHFSDLKMFYPSTSHTC